MILQYPKDHPESRKYIIGTEIGVTEILRREHPDMNFYPLNKKAVCFAMKSITLESVLECLQKIETDEYVIELDEEVIEKSKNAIQKMIEIS